MNPCSALTYSCAMLLPLLLLLQHSLLTTALTVALILK